MMSSLSEQRRRMVEVHLGLMEFLENDEMKSAADDAADGGDDDTDFGKLNEPAGHADEHSHDSAYHCCSQYLQ
jgi:cobyrinic acid a,c-diamide synthase